VTVEVLQTTPVFKGQVFDVRQDQVRFFDGKIINLDVVDHRDAVTILPLDQDGQIWFIRQYRHPAGSELLELPAGVTEEGEAPETGALRELREEIGMAAQKLLKLGGFFLAPGYSTEYMHVYLATGLYPSPLPGDEDEYLSIEKIAADQAIELAETGQLIDSKSLIALFWARPYLQNREKLPPD
jgi:ADP-ribose pyrophosphatase